MGCLWLWCGLSADSTRDGGATLRDVIGRPSGEIAAAVVALSPFLHSPDALRFVAESAAAGPDRRDQLAQLAGAADGTGSARWGCSWRSASASAKAIRSPPVTLTTRARPGGRAAILEFIGTASWSRGRGGAATLTARRDRRG